MWVASSVGGLIGLAITISKVQWWTYCPLSSRMDCAICCDIMVNAAQWSGCWTFKRSQVQCKPLHSGGGYSQTSASVTMQYNSVVGTSVNWELQAHCVTNWSRVRGLTAWTGAWLLAMELEISATLCTTWLGSDFTFSVLKLCTTLHWLLLRVIKNGWRRF